MPHFLIILFLFFVGASIGSFLNVVVWRLPRGKSLVYPPSACPKCNHRLAWRDNLPVIGWILLRGRCRYCREPISARYPIIEAVTGLLFVGYYVAFFVYGLGPSIPIWGDFGEVQQITLISSGRGIEEHWPIYGLLMLLISGLLAASLIDGELYIIPIEIPWLIAIFAFIVHPLIAHPLQPGGLSISPAGGALAIGATVGLLLANFLLWRKWLPLSFPKGEPMLEWERKAAEEQMKQQGASAKEMAELPPVATKREIRREIAKEVLFVAIPIVLGIVAMLLALRVDVLRQRWTLALIDHTWMGGLLGSIWGAIVGAMTIWLTRIFASAALGRVAMGQGDTHLMVAIGAVLGAGPTVAVFFAAPFAGLAIGLYKMLSKGHRELPYGPYLSLAAAVMIVAYRYIEQYFAPGLMMLWDLMVNSVGG